MACIWCSGVALSAQTYIFLQATINWILHCKPKLRDKITTLLAHCLNCAMSFLLGSFLYALRDEHMFSLDLFYVSICSTPGTHSHNTVQDMSAGHSPNDRCTSSELTRTDRERATTSTSWFIHSHRCGEDIEPSDEQTAVFLSRRSVPPSFLIKVLNSDSKFGSGFKRCLRLRGKDASLASVFGMNWNHS